MIMYDSLHYILASVCFYKTYEIHLTYFTEWKLIFSVVKGLLF